MCFGRDLLVGQLAGGGTTKSNGSTAARNLATVKFAELFQDATRKPIAINGFTKFAPGMLVRAITIPPQRRLSKYTSPPDLILVPEDCSDTQPQCPCQ
jgi:hypothetical protein